MYSTSMPSGQPRGSYGGLLPSSVRDAQHLNSSQSLAANIISYERIASSQESRIATVSQATSNSSGGYDEVASENPRSQVRFQEFIARSRHLESLEILHDIKKRMVFVEELSVAHNHKLSEQFQQLQKKVEHDAAQAINLSIQANASQSMIISDLRKQLDHQYLYLERLERKLDGLCDKLDLIKFLELSPLSRKSSFPVEDGITLEQYLQKGRKSRLLQDTAPVNHEHEELEALDIFETDLWKSNVEPSGHQNVKQYVQREISDADSDNTEMDCDLTPPISWTQYC